MAKIEVAREGERWKAKESKKQGKLRCEHLQEQNSYSKVTWVIFPLKHYTELQQALNIKKASSPVIGYKGIS